MKLYVLTEFVVELAQFPNNPTLISSQARMQVRSYEGSPQNSIRRELSHKEVSKIPKIISQFSLPTEVSRKVFKSALKNLSAV